MLMKKHSKCRFLARELMKAREMVSSKKELKNYRENSVTNLKISVSNKRLKSHKKPTKHASIR